jgi:hypothetical protein
MGGKKKKHKPTYRPAKPQKPKNELVKTSTEPAESPLLVFVSSLIDKMREERDAVHDAILSIPIARPWLFEYTPASSQETEEAYLSKVRECDIFIIVLGPEYSKAVEREYQIAVESKKPILAFVQKGEKSPEQNTFISSLSTKYAFYTSPENLQPLVLASVFDELVRRFKSTLNQAELPKLIETLPTQVRKPEEISGYVIVGMEDDTMEKVFELFGVTRPPENLEELHPSYNQVYFNNFSEMKDVFEALTRAAKKAQTVSGDRQEAYLRALKNESLELVSRYIMRQRSGKKEPQITVEGIKYFIWAVAPDIARIMTLMRPARIKEGPPPAKRTQHEYLFKDINYLLEVFTAIYQSSKDAGDDLDEFLRLLLLSAMKLQLPDLERGVGDSNE